MTSTVQFYDHSLEYCPRCHRCRDCGNCRGNLQTLSSLGSALALAPARQHPRLSRQLASVQGPACHLPTLARHPRSRSAKPPFLSPVRIRSASGHRLLDIAGRRSCDDHLLHWNLPDICAGKIKVEKSLRRPLECANLVCILKNSIGRSHAWRQEGGFEI